MARDTRRDFLKAAAAATLGAGVPARAQAAGSSVSSGTTGRPADLILKNGKIITVDAGFSIAQAIAIAGERIVAVGPDAAMTAHTAPWTRVIDLKGRPVIPGLIDGHAHMDREGLKAVYPSLGRVRSIRDIQDRIADLARGKKPGEWIVTMPIGDPPTLSTYPACSPRNAGRPGRSLMPRRPTTRCTSVRSGASGATPRRSSRAPIPRH